MSKTTWFCFDFDGTVSSVEALPLLAREAGIAEEMATLTDITMRGILAFPQSFKLRVKLLSSIPLKRAQNIMDSVPISPAIADFIRQFEKPDNAALKNLLGEIVQRHKVPFRFANIKLTQ